MASRSTSSAASRSPSGAGRTVPNTTSGTAPAAGMVIPDEEGEDEEGEFSTFNGEGTSDVEAIAQSQALGPSVRGKPIGMPNTVRIIVEQPAGDEIPPTGLPVSLNGKAYIIRPGEEVDVPAGVVEILDNAVMSIPVKDPQTMKVIGHRPRLRFPYRRVA